MNTKYEPIGRERFTVEQTARGEVVRVKAPRQIFVMLFLPFWLVMWTLGGGAALYTLLTHFQFFLLVWLCGWAAGWIAAAGTLLWMFAGSETISVVGSDIEIGIMRSASLDTGFTKARRSRISRSRRNRRGRFGSDGRCPSCEQHKMAP